MLKQCSVSSLIWVNTSQLRNESDSHKTSLLYLFDLKRPLIELRKALRSKGRGGVSPASFGSLHNVEIFQKHMKSCHSNMSSVGKMCKMLNINKNM